MKTPVSLLFVGALGVLPVGKGWAQPGPLDTTFQAPFSGGCVGALAVQTDGKILAAGLYLQQDGGGLARLNVDGSADPEFNPTILPFNEDFGLGGILWSVAVQPDGKILVGGRVRFAIDDVRQRATPIALLNLDGSVDMSFDSE